LLLNNALALQNSAVDMNAADAGTLNLNSLNATLGGLKGARSLALGSGTISVGNNNVANTYSGSLSGSALAKVGTGAWTLSGTNTFAGTTAVNAGELIGLTGGSLSNSTVTVNAGATNGVLLAAANGQWACGNLTYSAAAYADFNFNGLALSTTTAPLFVNGTVTFTVQPTVIVRSAGATIAPGTYPLIKYTGAAPGAVPTTLILPAGMTATLVNNTGNKSIDLNVTVGNQIYWAVGSAAWDINSTTSWKNSSGAAVNYLDGEAVLLDDNATASPTISLGVTVTPLSITVSNVAKAYTISPTAAAGVITGSGPLVKNGSGTLTIGTTNSAYTGTIALNGGTLALGSGANLGTGTLIMSNGTTLNVPNIAPVGTTPLIIVAAGATANHTVTGGTTGGFAGYIASGDSSSILTVGGASYSGAFQMFSNFTGTVQVNSGGSLRFSSSTGGASFGGSNTTFNVLGTLQPRDQAHNSYLGALTGSGTLGGPQTAPTGSGNTPYFIGSKNIDSTFSGTIAERGVLLTTNWTTSVTKIGSATLTLSGNSPYSSTTTVASGTLQWVTGGSCSNSAVTVNSGATNGVTVTVAGGFWTCTNLTYAAGTETAVFAFGANTPSTTVAPLQVQTGVTISGTLNILVTGGSTTIPVGTYPLIKYTGTQTGSAVTTPLSLPLGVYGVITNDAANKQIALVVTNVVVPSLLWNAGTGNWDANSINWTNVLAGGLTNWLDNYLAQFDDTASGAGPFTVTLTTNVNPIGVIVTNSTKDYTLAGGTITGSGALTKTGTGKLTLLTTNAATGGIVVSGGTLQGNHATLIGSIVNSAALVFDQSVNGSNNAVISGTGTLTKQNSGTLALGGNNIYTGKTFVNAGTLAISAGANLGANPGSATADQITINGGTLLATNGAATITLPTNAGLTITNTATIDVGAGLTLDFRRRCAGEKRRGHFSNG
jgi:autotransporter-associated beta strand protein